MPSPAVLAAAVGAESTSLAVFDAGAELRLARSATAANGEFAALRPMLRRFLAQDLGAIAAACVCVAAAGQPPRPSWPVTAADCAAALGLPEVELIGDAVAGGEWLLGLPPGEIEALPATGAASGAAGAGLWAAWSGGAAAPLLAWLRCLTGDGELEAEPAGPDAATTTNAAGVPAAGAAPGAGAPPAVTTLPAGAWLPALAASLREAAALVPAAAALPDGRLNLYLGGAGARALGDDDGRQLAAELRGRGDRRLCLHLVRRAPVPLWGAARRAWRLARRPRAASTAGAATRSAGLAAVSATDASAVAATGVGPGADLPPAAVGGTCR